MLKHILAGMCALFQFTVFAGLMGIMGTLFAFIGFSGGGLAAAFLLWGGFAIIISGVAIGAVIAVIEYDSAMY